MAQYHYKEFIPATGQTRSYMYNCEVLKKVGRYSFRIRIIGAIYKGRANAIVCVRRNNVRGYVDPDVVYDNQRQYKD
jgi:hypothetical protein